MIQDLIDEEKFFKENFEALKVDMNTLTNKGGEENVV